MAGELAPNRRLRLQRKLRGWSLNDAADALHRLGIELGEPDDLLVDGNTFCRWELGKRSPGPRYTRLLCNLYGLPANELGLVTPDGEALLEEEMRRREFLRCLALAGVAAVDPDRLIAALGMPVRVDHQLLDNYEAITRGFIQQWRSVAPAALVPPVSGHLALLTARVKEARPPAVERRLQSIAAETALLLGWLSFRLHNRGSASANWRLSETLAREADDDQLAAQVLLARSSIQSGVPTGGRGGDSAMALAALDHGLAKASPTGSAFLLARLRARRAEEYAIGRDRLGCLRDLDEADRQLSIFAQPGGERFDSWGRIQLDGYRGSCHLLLGSSREAIAILEPSIGNSDSGVGRAVLLADLGAGYAVDGQVDRACATLGEAASVASGDTASEFVQRVIGLRQRYLGPRSHEPAVRQLDERLASVS